MELTRIGQALSLHRKWSVHYTRCEQSEQANYAVGTHLAGRPFNATKGDD